MKVLLLLLPLLWLGLASAAALRAAEPKEYQLTGPVIALTDAVITIEKNGERWEIARTPATKVDGELVLGNRVTVSYRMAATSIETKNDSANLSKAEKAAKKADEAAERARQKAKQ